MNLQEQQAPIDRRIISALIEATPETWNAAEMSVTRSDDGTNEKLAIEIASPEGHTEMVGATEEIYQAIYDLSDCFRGFGKIWKEARYVAALNGSNDWQYEASFTY